MGHRCRRGAQPLALPLLGSVSRGNGFDRHWRLSVLRDEHGRNLVELDACRYLSLGAILSQLEIATMFTASARAFLAVSRLFKP
jgi:hypothetical protein